MEITRRRFLAALACAPLAPIAGLAAKLAAPRPALAANVRRALVVGTEGGKLAGVAPGRTQWTEAGDEYWSLAT